MNILSGISPLISSRLQQLPFMPNTGAIPTAELQSLANSAPTAAPSLTPAAPSATDFAAGTGNSTSFGDTLSQMIHDVNAKQISANDSASKLLAGDPGTSLHQTMINIEEARVSFQLMVEVRNKMLESYQEIMRMQV